MTVLGLGQVSEVGLDVSGVIVGMVLRDLPQHSAGRRFGGPSLFS